MNTKGLSDDALKKLTRAAFEEGVTRAGDRLAAQVHAGAVAIMPWVERDVVLCPKADEHDELNLPHEACDECGLGAK